VRTSDGQRQRPLTRQSIDTCHIADQAPTTPYLTSSLADRRDGRGCISTERRSGARADTEVPHMALRVPVRHCRTDGRTACVKPTDMVGCVGARAYRVIIVPEALLRSCH
jgi:hypothetical protein